MNSFLTRVSNDSKIARFGKQKRTRAMTMEDLIENKIKNVPVEKYHEFLMSDYAKNNNINMGPPFNNVKFIEYNEHAGVYQLMVVDSDEFENVTLNPMDHLPKEYSETNWHVFAELPDGSIKYLFEGTPDYALDINDQEWANFVYGNGTRVFALRKKTAEYIFEYW